ncbi:hypothetical protein WDU94_005823, partial [Cyamophila willieti]
STELTCVHCNQESSSSVDVLIHHLKVCPAFVNADIARTRRPCFACNYIARDMYDLRKHVRKHTNEKPFECLACEVRFRQISGALSHMKKQHKIVFLKDCPDLMDLYSDVENVE